MSSVTATPQGGEKVGCKKEKKYHVYVGKLWIKFAPIQTLSLYWKGKLFGMRKIIYVYQDTDVSAFVYGRANPGPYWNEFGLSDLKLNPELMQKSSLESDVLFRKTGSSAHVLEVKDRNFYQKMS
jgi:hypothetical protein